MYAQVLKKHTNGSFFQKTPISLFALQCTICIIQITKVHKTKCYEHRRNIYSTAYILKTMFYDYSGPVWFRNKSKKVLLASRRHELSRRRKHTGNIADGLRCSPWRRAQEPGKQLHQLCGGDKHGQGITAIVHPS